MTTARTTWPQAAELQAAADTLRDRAQRATPGPWRNHDTHLGRYGHTATVLSGDGNNTDLRAWLPSLEHEPWDERRNVWHDAAYIATVDPAAGLAVADLLDGLANTLAWLAPYREHEPGYPMWEAAVALARAINGPPTTATTTEETAR